MTSLIEQVSPREVGYAKLNHGAVVAGFIADTLQNLNLMFRPTVGPADHIVDIGIQASLADKYNVSSIPLHLITMRLAVGIAPLTDKPLDPVVALLYNINVDRGTSYHPGAHYTLNCDKFTDPFREASAALLVMLPPTSVAFITASGTTFCLGSTFGPTTITLVGGAKATLAVGAGLGFYVLDRFNRSELRKYMGKYVAAGYSVSSERNIGDLFYTAIGQALTSMYAILAVKPFGAVDYINLSTLPFDQSASTADAFLSLIVNGAIAGSGNNSNLIDVERLVLSYISWMEIKSLDYEADGNVSVDTRDMSPFEALMVSGFVATIHRNQGIPIVMGSLLHRMPCTVEDFKLAVTCSPVSNEHVGFYFLGGAPFYAKLTAFNVVAALTLGQGVVSIPELGIRSPNVYSRLAKQLMFLIGGNEATDRHINPFYYLAGSGDRPTVLLVANRAQLTLGLNAVKTAIADGSGDAWIVAVRHIVEEVEAKTKDLTLAYSGKSELASMPKRATRMLKMTKVHAKE